VNWSTWARSRDVRADDDPEHELDDDDGQGDLGLETVTKIPAWLRPPR
jgi:hypothetical protein